MLCFLPLLVACKKDQVQEEQNAMNFTAVIVPMASENEDSRVLPYDTWAGLSDRRVAVKVDGEIKAYSVDACKLYKGLIHFSAKDYSDRGIFMWLSDICI